LVQELFQSSPFNPARQQLFEEIKSKGLLPEFHAEVKRRASQASAVSPEQRKELAYQAELEAARGSGREHLIVGVFNKWLLQIESEADKAQYLAEIGERYGSFLADHPWYKDQTEQRKRIAEQRELASSRARALDRSSAGEMVEVQSEPHGNESTKAPETSASASARFGKLTGPKLAIAKILENSPRKSDHGICLLLDKYNQRDPLVAPILSTWKARGVRSWVEALTHATLKPAVQSYISKVRRQVGAKRR